MWTEPFSILLFIASVIAGGVASISGFGIGSTLSPLLATKIGLKLAVAAVSIPHLIATIMRCWMLRRHINYKVLLTFGTFSAIGGLTGAFFHNNATSPVLIYLFSALLLYVGVTGLTDWSARFRIPARFSGLAGIASGVLGGLVGNQGGIRSAALLGFELTKEEFVATATATGVIVDLARMPVYLATEWADIFAMWPYLVIATAGCVVGTFAGRALLSKVPERTFKLVVSLMLIALGIYMAVSQPT
jgi:uncharacterized protein